MNLYFLVEGSTEKHIYPLWIKELVPNLTPVSHYDEVEHNNYYVFTAGGFPSILDEIVPAVEEMDEMGNYDYLVIALDADDLTVAEVEQEVRDYIREEEIEIDESKLRIIVQNRCFETWCLGNRRIYPTNIDDDFRKCEQFYNVRDHDPEQMMKDSSVTSATTIAQYHAYYLKKMFNQYHNLTYVKGQENSIVGRAYYLEQLMKRANETTALASFRYFLRFLETIQEQVAQTS